MPPLEINLDSPLHRYYWKYQIEDAPWLSSLDMGLWYILVRQHGKFESANKLILNEKLVKNPHSIPLTASRYIGKLSADWIFAKKEVYLALMVFLLQKRNNQFYYEFVYLSHTHGNADIDFFMPGNDHLWSTGLRTSQVQSYGFSGNQYGKLVKEVYEQWKSGAFDAAFNVPGLLSELVNFESTFRKTVLILSDSLSRQLRSVAGGTVISIGGAGYDKIAEEIRQRHIDLQDYCMVVIVCGTNVARKGMQRWEESWKPLEDLLLKIPEHSDTHVILNSPILHTKLKNVPEHTAWMKNRFKDTFPSNKFKFCDYSQEVDTRFRNPDGTLKKELFKGIHLNFDGYRCLWFTWCRRQPALRFIAFRMSEDIYPNEDSGPKGRAVCRMDNSGGFSGQ